MTPDEVMKDIHDIRPPVMVGMDPAMVRLCIYILAGLVAGAVIFFLVRRLLKGRKTKAKPPAIPMIPPYDTAVAALDQLSQLGGGAALDSAREAKRFYFELGRIIKQYLGATRGFNCLEMTTQELGRQLKSVNDLPGSLKSEVVGFQDICDPFRYAPDLVPEKDRVDRDLAKGRALIEAMEKARGEAAETALENSAANADNGEEI